MLFALVSVCSLVLVMCGWETPLESTAKVRFVHTCVGLLLLHCLLPKISPEEREQMSKDVAVASQRVRVSETIYILLGRASTAFRPMRPRRRGLPISWRWRRKCGKHVQNVKIRISPIREHTHPSFFFENSACEHGDRATRCPLGWDELIDGRSSDSHTSCKNLVAAVLSQGAPRHQLTQGIATRSRPS